MFAVIRTGGKQYRVAKDDVIRIEKLAGNAGETVSFDEVLMVADEAEPAVGAPLVEGATVVGEVVEQTRAAKIVVFKKKRRKNYRRTAGHRQHQTVVRITDILTGGAKPKAARRAAPKAAPAEAAPAAAAAAPEPAAEAVEAPMFTAPEGRADDLKRIAGVGPAIEAKLNALGITRFSQIAGFTAEEIARVDEALSFKGRIEREGWIDQARKLADEAES